MVGGGRPRAKLVAHLQVALADVVRAASFTQEVHLQNESQTQSLGNLNFTSEKNLCISL